jgi:hypothetical protein
MIRYNNTKAGCWPPSQASISYAGDYKVEYLDVHFTHSLQSTEISLLLFVFHFFE